MRKRCFSLAAVVVCLLPPQVRADRASCPLSTRVTPLVGQTIRSYAVRITDGHAGDLDGVADGACDIELEACVGGPDCGPATIRHLRAVARGGSADPAPRAVAAALLDAFVSTPGADDPGSKGIAFGKAASVSACGTTRVRLPVWSRAAQSFTLRLGTRGGAAPATVRMHVRCIAARPGAPDGPACVDPRGSACPGTVAPPGGTEPPPGGGPPPPADPEPAPGGAYYLSPTGSDRASGTSADTPLRSFDAALGRLAPGDTLILLDGTYTRDITGLPRIDCGAGGNARSGTPDRPITLRAANERRAFLSSDGLQAGLEMTNCSWWRVEGLRAASRDEPSGLQSGGYPFRVHEVSNVTLRRLLGSHNNRPHNTHVFAVENSRDVLLEECEAYYFHRHAFSIWRSYGVTIRRCYANSMRYGEVGCCSAIDNRPYGDEAYSLYGTSASVIENSVSENHANGFQIHGIRNDLDPSGSGGRDNQVLGSISLDDDVSALVSSRDVEGEYRNARGNVFRDFVAVRTSGYGLFLRGAADTLVENVTLYGSRGGSGLVADAGDARLGGTCGARNADGCGFTARNVLSLEHPTGLGIAAEGQRSWRIENSDASGSATDWLVGERIDDASGNVRRSSRRSAGPVGPGRHECLLWIPAGSPMKGAGSGGRDIGAGIVNRYENGTLTDVPLWDPQTGAFPCGAIVPGINDGDVACANLHRRLNANTNGCPLP
jgi:hypothetical protein